MGGASGGRGSLTGWPGLRRRLVLVPLLVVSTLSFAQAGEGEFFRENFDRPDGVADLPGWLPQANRNRCVEGGEPERAAPEPSEDALFLSLDTPPAVTPPELPLPDRGEAVPEIREGRLSLKFEKSQGTQGYRRIFHQALRRLEFDYTPLYAMGGVDDRAWLGVRIRFFDSAGRSLGEIRHFYHNDLLPDDTNGATIRTLRVKGGFDGVQRHLSLDVERLLRERLTGVDPRAVVASEVGFEAGSDLCDASVEGVIDNVVVQLGGGSGLTLFSRDEVLDIVRGALVLYKEERAAFPGNWLAALHGKYGREKLQAWLRAIPPPAQADPVRLADLLGEVYGLTGKNAFLSGFVISLLLRHP
ncbi:MAG: hypothetical protein HQL59_05475 [Magnetococcales bacterium]|nr:hypothetical protein [Magnetococcales bacterium]